MGGMINNTMSTGMNQMPKPMMGKTMMAKGGTPFGSLSVEAGIDKNPNPTQADRIAGATKNNKRGLNPALSITAPAGKTCRGYFLRVTLRIFSTL